MLARFIKPLLLVTGLITLAPVLEFLFPDQMNFFPGIEVLGETGKFMVRHHALEIACIGGLLIYAAFNTAARLPILVAAIVGKGGMVYMLLTELGNPVFGPMNGTHGDTGMFATVFFGILDLQTCTLTYANCGHLSPLLLNEQGVKQTLDLTGPALGAVPCAEHAIREVKMEHGDLLFAYTDGLTDTENPLGEIFSIGTLIPYLTQEQSLAAQLEHVIALVEVHAADTQNSLTISPCYL